MRLDSPAGEAEHGAKETRCGLQNVCMGAEHNFAILRGQDNVAIWAREVGVIRVIAFLVVAGNDRVLANEVSAAMGRADG